ncbi:helix-hairpin-helix domain-containing protein [Candidatus Acetothermia bacterium]|nr:helix-hairpin-helix domain-containing protein [Candidatus Acetothermia bacterium]MBI3643427.1 helix-hairpin-helix domain-containing protein [Candidatus Acetothermia bacterium]
MTLTRSDGRVLFIMAAIGMLSIFYGLISADHSNNQNFMIQAENQSKLPLITDLNRASYAELLDIPGIGPTLAQRILEYRMAYGPFLRWEELDKIRGIGPTTLKKIRETAGVCMGPNCK